MKALLWSDIHMGYSNNTYKNYYKFIKKKLLNEEFDVMLLAGDLASHQQKNLNTLFRLLRDFFPNKKIYWVRGNHDFWDANSWNPKKRRKYYLKELFTYNKIIDYHNKISNKYQIYQLRRFSNKDR